MDEPQTVHIKPVTPRREWLLRCSDNNADLAVCSICVSNGDIEIISPDIDTITLEPAQIAEFHHALHAAIALAETDLAQREQRAPRPSQPTLGMPGRVPTRPLDPDELRFPACRACRQRRESESVT